MDRRNLLALMAGSALTSVMGTQAWAQATGLKAEAFKEVDARAVMVQQMVDTVFSFGEPGFEEVRTSAYLTGVLEQNGFKVQRGVAGIPTAFIATWGEGGPLIALGSDIDGLRGLSQIPGVPKPTPMVAGAPGHGEGHNAGMPLMIAAAIAAKKVMTDHKIPGRLMLWPGVAEELIGSKAHYVQAGLFKDVDACIFAHVADKFGTAWGDLANNAAVSVEFTFHGLTAHAAGAPWNGKSALDGVEVMDVAWNMRREHLPLSQRSHYVITNGGDQPNIVPDKAAVWYYFRDKDFASVRKLYETGVEISEAAAKATATTVTRQILGYAAPNVGNKPLAEAMQANIDLVGMPAWSADDEAFAARVQQANGFKPRSWPTRSSRCRRRKSAGPTWAAARTTSATSCGRRRPSPCASRRTSPAPARTTSPPPWPWPPPSPTRARSPAPRRWPATVLDLMTQPKLIADAKDWFNTVQLKDQKYDPILTATDKPAIDINAKLMKEMRPQMEPFYFDAKKHKTYLEQLGVKYPG
jgi:aminobenzoyl-glutamate utilization protein B